MKIITLPKLKIIFNHILVFIYLSSSLALAADLKYLYDDLGQLKKVVDEAGNVATYNYDAVGNLLSITRSTGGIQSPAITGITPANTTVGSSIKIAITGNNFLGAAISTDNPEIRVSNLSASETLINADFNISFLSLTGQTKITVTTPFGSTFTTIRLDPASPTITSITPGSGPPTRFVTIKGTAFSPVPAENIVRFNGTAATVLSSDVFNIYTQVPAGATTGSVTVTTNGLISNNFPFTVTTPTGSPPAITSVKPNFGPVSGGARITITGEGFISGTTIQVGKRSATNISIISDKTLSFTTPSGSEGWTSIL